MSAIMAVIAWFSGAGFGLAISVNPGDGNWPW